MIPDTFEGYKKQRFRWTYGPVQTLKRHRPLFLGRSRFTLAQWVHHLNHGLDRAGVGLGLLLLPLGVALLASIALHREVIAIPFALWAMAFVGLASGLASTALIYRVVLRCSLSDFLGAFIASRSLSHVVAVASAWAIVTRTIPWRRTSKFKPLSLGPLAAVRSAQTELVIGLLVLVAAGASALALRPQGLVVMLLIGAVMQSLNYLAAPVAALLSERHVRAQQERSSDARLPERAIAMEA